MMMTQIERSTFNKQYNYRLVMVSDNIDFKHCGNCAHTIPNEHHASLDGCYLMVQSRIPTVEVIVNRRRGLCNLWQEQKDGKNAGDFLASVKEVLK